MPALRKKLKISDQRQVHTPEVESDANADSSDDELHLSVKSLSLIHRRTTVVIVENT